MGEQRTGTIVTIDDDPDMQDLIRVTLERAGHVVHSASSGPEGLALVAREHPELILLDVMMPGMDGYEVCGRLQAAEETAYIPVVFLTALVSDQDRRRALASGAVGHLSKPFDPVTLQDAVKEALERTCRWGEIADESGAWTERIVPDHFETFRGRLAARFDEASAEAAALLTTRPRSLYEAARAAGLTDFEVVTEMSAFLGLPLRQIIDSQAVLMDALPAPFCRANAVVALREAADVVTFVVSNPFRWELLDLLQRRVDEMGMSLALEIAPPKVIRSFYDLSADPEAQRSSLADTLVSVDVATEPGQVAAGDLEAAPVVFIANNIITSALKERASDIHFEPKEDRLEVRFRVDGDMADVLSLRPSTGMMLVSRLKALGSLDIAERRKPQDGSLEAHIGGKRIKLRLATSSGPYGESMVVRILEVTADPVPLESLGFTDEQATLLRGFATRPQGMVLVVGPTGSGKTTTIYSVLSGIDTEHRSLMTVEDPVEYIIPRANHQQVNDKAGVSFENLLKSSVRQDPDVLFLGEIRDQFSARTALDFASTGHLTVSTLHTSNATSAVFRLERLGVDRSIMADAILGIVSQRLVKRVCPECRTITPITAEERAWLEPFTNDVPETVAHASADGCPSCRKGYQGRIGIQEIIQFDAEIASWVRDGAPITEIRQRLVDRGDYLSVASVLDKIRDHVVDPNDAYHKIIVEEQAAPSAQAPQFAPAAPQPAPAAPSSAPSVAGPVIGTSEPPQADAPGVEMIGAAPPRRALVADDDVSVRELVGMALREDGFQVEFAENGRVALEQLASSAFDLIVSDMNMPELDGMGFLRATRQSGVSAPFLMLTGVNDGQVEADALMAGASDYVRKPVRKDVLMMRVRRVLAGSL